MQIEWQITHGQVRGAYLSLDGVEAYIRQDGATAGRWLVFIQGEPVPGTVSNERSARAAAELLLRERVIRANASRVAAAAG